MPGLLHQLAEKPWLDVASGPAGLVEGRAFAVPAARLGVRLFCCVVAVLFLLLIVAYAGRMADETLRPAPALWLMWLNTALLAAAGAGMQGAVIAVRDRRMKALRACLVAGSVLAVAFLAGQLVAWRQLARTGAFDVTDPAVGFFYLITALHGLHLLGGLVALALLAVRLPGAAPERRRQGVELCAVYWHFLLAVWLVLFGLLFSGNDSLGILLALCGVR